MIIAARVDSRSCPRPACALTAARIARGEGRHPGHSAFTPRAGPPFPCPALQWEVRTTHAAVGVGLGPSSALRWRYVNVTLEGTETVLDDAWLRPMDARLATP
jgi:hypothetical protein